MPKDKTFDVKKDPIDLRDVYYEGSLIELPVWVDNRRKVPFVLNQGEEGACTGFGLAAVVNFLMAKIRLRSSAFSPGPLKRKDGASPRMLYEMARRYDEWEGEDYDGSSIRGAMKGWHKHGVCAEKEWPYDATVKKSRLSPKRQSLALKHRLGNYFRVRHLHLSQMHSALVEAGILYASSAVHSGWDHVDPETGKIEMRDDNHWGHAFAIVGYDHKGFWVQNSWGPKWGVGGFAHLSYDDWLENAYDCWVARMAVGTTSVTLEQEGTSKLGKRSMSFDYIPHQEVVFSAIRPHMVNLGNNGRLSGSGRYQTDKEDVDEIFSLHLPKRAETWGASAPRLLLYAHGGLNNEKAPASRIASMKPYFLANEIFPIHFMWETGLFESITGIAKDAVRNPRFGGAWDTAQERFLDLVDEGIELATRSLGRAVWNEMKGNAESASLDDGGADLLAGKLAQYVQDGNGVELHLLGHSAGSIFLSYLIPTLNAWSLKVKTCTFYAPACTTELFNEYVVPYFGSTKCIDRLTVFNLSDEVERDDSVAGVYNKSLLYLVSEAFESRRHMPLLGMEKHFSKQFNSVKQKFFGKPVVADREVIYTKGGPSVGLECASTTHGGFDNDPKTLNSTLRIIRGTNTLVKSFENN